MRPTGGPQKLRFTVHACSGEDSDYPVRELLYHSPQTRGWQSPRFCKYPQEVVLRLESTSKIQQIQILSHEYKIATRVEVFVGCPSNPADADPNTCIFKRLGYLSFDSNERSSHQARELKSVHVNVPALLVRLVIHRCHVNKLNIYNQVGIIALNLIGERIAPPPDGPMGFLQLQPPVQQGQPYYNAAAADIADLNLDIHVDTVTAAKIRELARQKDQAVANEDYDTAKAIKASIDRLKILGQKIAQLEARKRAAVEKEDYDTAKLIKADIDKLRSTGEGAAMDMGSRSRRQMQQDPDEIFSRVLGSKGGNSSMNSRAAAAVGASSGDLPFDEQPIRPAGGASGRPPPMQDSEQVDGEPPEDDYPDDFNPDAAPPSTAHNDYDNRPAMGKGRYTPTVDGDAPPDTAPKKESAAPITAPPPKGWPSELPAPEHPTGKDAAECGPLQELAGEYVAAAFYSKNWQLRDAAVSYLIKQVTSGQFPDKSKAMKVLTKSMQRGMKDKVANVYLGTLGMMAQLIDTYGDAVGPSAVENVTDTALPLLVDKLGDNNPRLRDASKDSIMYLAGVPEAALRAHTSDIVKPIKSQTAWRPVLGILMVLQDLVPVVGMGRAGDGFDLQELMDFVGKAYNSPNGDVRSASVKVTAVVFNLVGPAIRKFMPKDINPKIKEQVDAVLEGEPAGPPMVPVPPPPRAAPAAPPPRPVPPAKPPANAKPAAAKSRPQSTKGGPPPPVAPPPPASAGPPDDVAAFEAELKSREKALGPNHPDVAESCSNLAILYNQQGNGAKALPLYERALKIYEKHYGPDHPEVAHTLTDLAVLHLEQGREDIGRPLLERALVIQTKALGPDHPDVLAIKDVLNSE